MNTFFFDDVQYPEGLFGGKDFFNPIIYSTEEREVGVWTDDKPLYQKTIRFQITGGTTYIDLSSLDVENVVYEEGYVIHNNGKYKLDLPYYESNNYKVFTNYVTDNMNAIAINSGSGIVTYYPNGVLTIQYTKISDVAGSGQYTTLGVPAHHYDGNEKVIGTWFGETLYEKTFDCGGLLNAQTKEISYTENMDTIIIVDAFAMSTNEGYVIPIPDVVPNYVTGSLRLYINKTAKKICIYTQTDMRTYDKSYVTLRYTKTS